MQKLCTWAGVAAFALLGANVSNASTASFIFDNENNNRLWFTGGDGDTRVYTSVLFCSEGLSLGFGQDESSVSIAERVSCGGVMTTQFLLPWVSPENALAATAGFYDGDVKTHRFWPAGTVTLSSQCVSRPMGRMPASLLR